ncbi:hypothetical protein AX16_001043 [Volvariella volvacea WC 439]|nr:hypothetical protein AX16_001043 [Volvariella volvacea WC 439]
MARSRVLFVFLWLLALVLVGTVVVLSSVTYYLAIDPSAYLTEDEVPILDNTTRWRASDHGQVERVPRIIHQTWKSETLPPRWKEISQACRDMMPDYEYMLWTDASSREFIATHYPWFLDTFDGYDYVIQRADAIRYFVLHHYGGVYMDLDIGCSRPMDPLLVYPLILPKTIPVGVSNDLMFAEPGHPFLTQAIHNLITFDHSWVLNYPTVMFSTGPMFLSIQYGLYTSHLGNDVRILPKSLYGKNAKEGEAPNSFFSHYYGSSWHSDDAAFISFLGNWGKGLMWIGLLLLIIGIYKLPSRQRKYSFRRIGSYEILLPRWSQRYGRWQLHLGWSSMPSSATSTNLPSPVTNPTSPIDEEISLLHLPLDAHSFTSTENGHASRITNPNPILNVLRRVRTRVHSLAGLGGDGSRSPTHSRGPRGVLFFLPTIFTQPQDTELDHTPHPSRSPSPPLLSQPIGRTPPEKLRLHQHLSASTSEPSRGRHDPPP